MKKLRIKKMLAVSALMLLPSSVVMASSDCTHLMGCERKFCEIETQLAQAKKQDNYHKVNGLTKALEAAKANCSNASLRQELIEDIDDVNEDIAEYTQALEEAKAEGKQDKMMKYQHKLQSERQQLQQLEAELSSLK